jgi:hypothetical protein
MLVSSVGCGDRTESYGSGGAGLTCFITAPFSTTASSSRAGGCGQRVRDYRLRQEFITPYTPEQKGIIERFFRSLTS